MTTLLLLIWMASADPFAEDTTSWTSIRHGGEEIRYRREGRTMLLALRNHEKRPLQVDVVWRELGIKGTVRVYDVTSGKDEGKVQGGFAKKLAGGQCHGFRLTLP